MIQFPEVLIIDSDEEAALLLKKTYLSMGYPTHICASGEDALRYVETEMTPLIFLAQDLPGMNGLDVLNGLYNINSACQVIMMIGETNLRSLMMSIRGRIPNFLFKPISTELAKIAVKKAEQNYRIDKEKGLLLDTLERDIKVASKVQQQLNFQRNLHVENVIYSAACIAKRYLNADFFRFYKQSSTKLFLLIGGITSSGITSALLAQEAIHLANGFSDLDTAPFMYAWNNAIVDRLGSCSLNALAATIDGSHGVFEFVSCGNPFPVLQRSDASVEILRHPNQSIGVLHDVEFKSAKVALSANDTLYLFTDGMLEFGMGQQGNMSDVYEKSHLLISQAISNDEFASSAQRVLAHFRESLYGGFKDDVALALLKYSHAVDYPSD